MTRVSGPRSRERDRPSDRAKAAELVDLSLRLGLGNAVTFLQLSGQLLAAAIDHIQVIISEFAPLFADATRHWTRLVERRRLRGDAAGEAEVAGWLADLQGARSTRRNRLTAPHAERSRTRSSQCPLAR